MRQRHCPKKKENAHRYRHSNGQPQPFRQNVTQPQSERATFRNLDPPHLNQDPNLPQPQKQFDEGDITHAPVDRREHLQETPRQILQPAEKILDNKENTPSTSKVSDTLVIPDLQQKIPPDRLETEPEVQVDLPPTGDLEEHIAEAVIQPEDRDFPIPPSPARQVSINPPHQQIQSPPSPPEDVAEATLQPDDMNFPKLPSPAREANRDTPQNPASPPPAPTHFVWRKPTPTDSQSSETHRGGGEDKGKGKQVSKTPDSAPLTRQGYRSGRLAEDFWTALNTPNTPATPKKTLRVLPLLIKTKKDETLEFLGNTKAAAVKPFAQVHIAELLAGVPWTETRVRQHVVNEVAQALYKALVFTNPAQNPLQRWKQGKWFAKWDEVTEGEHACTLYVSVFVQESRIKPRKGQSCSWHKLPDTIKNHIDTHASEAIEAITGEQAHWSKITQLETNPSLTKSETATKHPNRFAVLSEDEILL